MNVEIKTCERCGQFYTTPCYQNAIKEPVEVNAFAAVAAVPGGSVKVTFPMAVAQQVPPVSIYIPDPKA